MPTLVLLGICAATPEAGAVQTQRGRPLSAATGIERLQPNETCSITGRRVRGPEREDYGRVVDVLVDRDGRPQLAVIDFGGFLGIGHVAIAVPWTHLHFSPAAGPNAVIQLDLTPDQLRAYSRNRPGAGPATLAGRPGC